MDAELLFAELLHIHVTHHELKSSAIVTAVMHVCGCMWHVVSGEQQQRIPHSGMAHADAHVIHSEDQK